MCDVFVSYVEEDSPVAMQIIEALENAGYITWYYERDSIPGISYLTQTHDAIGKSTALILIASKDSINSNQITSEIERAHEEGIPIIPVLFEITHKDLREQTVIRQAIGTRTSIKIQSEGVGVIMPRLITGLEKLGVQRSAAKRHGDPDKTELDKIIAMSSVFFADKTLEDRRSAAEQILQIAPKVKLSDIMQLCKSKEKGERLAAFIALRAYLNKGIPAEDREKIAGILQNGMKDGWSRVRYRAFEAIGADSEIRNKLKPLLEKALDEDDNESVRDIAARILQGG